MVKISACVIVKNEEKNLPVWLENMRQVADEWIVVDTGSTDRTIEIARESGARVFSYEWQEDFAAAKNYALEQAAGEWILFLDADEYFSPRALPRVRECIRRYHPQRKVVALICRLLNIDSSSHNAFLNEAFQARVFRNSRILRYAGRIHEGLQCLAKNRRMQVVQELEIYHTGYSLDVFRSKCERNLRMLEKEIREGGEKPVHWPYLMKCWYGLEDYEKSLFYAEKAIAADIQFTGMDTAAYEMKLNSLMGLHRPTAEIMSAIQSAMERFPEYAEFYLFRAFFLFDDGDYLRAGQDLQRGLALYYAPEGRAARGEADNASGSLPQAHLCLGRIAQCQGKIAEALDQLVESLRLYPYQPEALLRLYECTEGQEPVDIIRLLNSLYNKEKDAAFLTEVLEQRYPGPVCLYYARFAQKYEETRQYIFAGRYSAAAVAITAKLDTLYRLGIAAAELEPRTPGGSLLTLLPEEYRQAWQNIPGKADGIKNVVRRMQAGWQQKADLPLVSILIPTYNRPELFALTMQSALAQTYPMVEIIVCDNSTDDRTEQVMKQYETDPRVRYVRNRQARNKAENFQSFERLARGEYLQWLMDDDILAPEKLLKMVPILQNNPGVTMVTSERGIIDAEGKRMESPFSGIVQTQNEFALLDGQEAGRLMLVRAQNFLGEPSAVLFRRRDLVHHYWQAECRGYKTISDVAMWLELLEKGHCVYFMQPLSYYRRHAAQEGQQANVVLLSRIEWFRLVSEYYERHIFLNTAGVFHEALGNLYRDYGVLRNSGACQMASADMRQHYESCMEKIGQELKVMG